MKKFTDFSKTQKTRFVSFLILTAILMIYVNAVNVISIFSNPLFEKAEELYIDGSDFTSIANFGINVMNFIVQLVVDAVTNLVLIIISLVLFIPWRVIMITRETHIDDDEYNIYKITNISFFTINIVIGIVCAIASPSMTLLSIASETFFLMIVYLILVILPTRKAHLNDGTLKPDITIIS